MCPVSVRDSLQDSPTSPGGSVQIQPILRCHWLLPANLNLPWLLYAILHGTARPLTTMVKWSTKSSPRGMNTIMVTSSRYLSLYARAITHSAGRVIETSCRDLTVSASAVSSTCGEERTTRREIYGQ